MGTRLMIMDGDGLALDGRGKRLFTSSSVDRGAKASQLTGGGTPSDYDGIRRMHRRGWLDTKRSGDGGSWYHRYSLRPQKIISVAHRCQHHRPHQVSDGPPIPPSSSP